MGELEKKFIEQIKLRGFDDQYIDAKEEKEILTIAIEGGATLEAAQKALRQVCERQQYALESYLLERIDDCIDTYLGDDGKIDEKEFNSTLTTVQKACYGKLDEKTCKKMIVRQLEKDSAKIKTGMFSNWYKKLKDELGMV